MGQMDVSFHGVSKTKNTQTKPFTTEHPLLNLANQGVNSTAPTDNRSRPSYKQSREREEVVHLRYVEKNWDMVFDLSPEWPDLCKYYICGRGKTIAFTKYNPPVPSYESGE